MPHRPKKPDQSLPAFMPKNVEEGLPISQPPEENFFLATVIIRDPSNPCWDDGFSVVGPWDVVSRAISKFLVDDPRARKSSVAIFQGEDARAAWIEGTVEEARYQEQKRAQPNN